jgi:hypothetical protein
MKPPLIIVRGPDEGESSMSPSLTNCWAMSPENVFWMLVVVMEHIQEDSTLWALS